LKRFVLGSHNFRLLTRISIPLKRLLSKNGPTVQRFSITPHTYDQRVASSESGQTEDEGKIF
jgi:hypothetical protein